MPNGMAESACGLLLKNLQRIPETRMMYTYKQRMDASAGI
jgi:hypothetical protein